MSQRECVYERDQCGVCVLYAPGKFLKTVFLSPLLSLPPFSLSSPPSLLQGISAHSEEMLKNMEFISQAQSKGLVMCCWGDDNNNHNNRNTLREQGIDGLIYDR